MSHNWQPINTAPHDGTWVWLLLEIHRSLGGEPFKRRVVRLGMWDTMDATWYCPYNRQPVTGDYYLAFVIDVAWHPFERPTLPPEDEFTER
jgi:hypothetical protein